MEVGNEKISYNVTLGRILMIVAPFKKMIAIAVFVMSLSMIAGIFIPLIEQELIDDGILSNEVSKLVSFVLALIILRTVQLIIIRIQSGLLATIQTSLKKNLRDESFTHLLNLNYSSLKNGSQQYYQNFEYDVNLISMMVGQVFLTVFSEFLRIFGSIIGLMIISWKLTLFVALLIPIKIFISNFYKKKLDESSVKLLQTKQKFHKWLGGIFNTVTDIKLWNLQPQFAKQFNEFSSDESKFVKEQKIIQANNDFVDTSTQYVVFNLIYLLGGLLLWRSELTIGSIVTFITYAGFFVLPLDMFRHAYMSFIEIAPSLDNYFEYMSMKEENYNGQQLGSEAIYNITLSNVSKSYNDRTVLSNFSVDFKKGEKIAIVGENGSGKSTLANLILQLESPDSGQIFINNCPATDLSITEYRKLVNVVSQDVFLFNATIRENIDLFGNNLNVSIEDIPESLKFYEEKDFPDGINTNVGINGNNLSGGEKQKVSLIRTLMSDSQVIILDEPTSALDKDTTSFIKQTINKLSQKIVFLITHDQELLTSMDRIIVLDRGEIIADGDYETIKNAL